MMQNEVNMRVVWRQTLGPFSVVMHGEVSLLTSRVVEEIRSEQNCLLLEIDVLECTQGETDPGENVPGNACDVVSSCGSSCE